MGYGCRLSISGNLHSEFSIGAEQQWSKATKRTGLVIKKAYDLERNYALFLCLNMKNDYSPLHYEQNTALRSVPRHSVPIQGLRQLLHHP